MSLLQIKYSPALPHTVHCMSSLLLSVCSLGLTSLALADPDAFPPTSKHVLAFHTATSFELACLYTQQAHI